MKENHFEDHHRLESHLNPSRDINIPIPELNEDTHLIEYTGPETETGHMIAEMLRSNVSPELYPNAIDLFTGNGPIAQILVAVGWKAENITCVDRFKPRKNLVQDATWLFWHLDLLGYCNRFNYEIPEEIEKYREKFDFATMVQPETNLYTLEPIADFLLRPKGIAFFDFSLLPNKEITRKWKHLKGSHFLFEKQF